MIVAVGNGVDLCSVHSQPTTSMRYAMREVVIVDSVRTGLAKSFRGKFNMTRPDDMAAHCVNALLTRNDIDPASVEDCIVGAGSNEGAQGYNIGRNVAVLSHLGIGTAGMTLNRFCSSGLQAIAIAANQIASGCSEIIVAGGVESISLTMKSVNTDNLINPLLKEQVPGIYFPMGQTAEIVARRYNVSREAQDIYALQSQQRTAQAQAAGLFDDEIVPMAVKYRVEDKSTGQVQIIDGIVERDDCNRPDTTLQSLAGLKPVFAEDGSVTAGNSSQLSDGASMTLVMSLEKALELGLKPKAFFRGFTVAGCARMKWASARCSRCRSCSRPRVCRSLISTCGSSTKRLPPSASTAAIDWKSTTRNTTSTAGRFPLVIRLA